MTLHMKIQTSPGGSFTTVDLVSEGIGGFLLSVDYSAPTSLRFRVHQASHTLPLGIRNYIKFWDDTGGTYSESSPLFEGFLWETQPDTQDANLVTYVAYDPTHMVGREVPVYSISWDAGTPPTPNATAVPRIVVNCYQDSDSDYATQRDTDVSVGGLIMGLLDDAILPLRYWNAAPSGSDAYESPGELDDLTYQPQDKIVIENQYLTPSIRQALTHYPARRLLWEPGTRLWKFHDLKAGSQRTVILNDPTVSHPCLGCDIRRSLDNCYTAVKIFGPEQVETAEYTTGASAPFTLSTIATLNLGSYTDGSGTHDLDIPYLWQIDEPTLRRGGRRLEEDYLAPMGEYNWTRTRSPHLQLSFDGGTSWITILNPLMDFLNGIVGLNIAPFYFVDPPPYLPTSDQSIFGPTHARLVWAAFVAPLSVRYPSSGYEGTAYSVANMQSEMVQYDPTLAAGYEWGTAVVTATREAQFSEAAKALLDQRKDIAYSGVLVQNGLNFDYLNLNRRLNITAHDEDGNDLTTGWEEIDAPVTGAQFDFEERTTTLTINGDHLELMGEDPEQIKRRLGIRQLIQGYESSMSLIYSFYNLKYGNVPVVTGAVSETHATYTDPVTGEQQ